MRILLVSYFYPPDRSVGAIRWPPLVQALRERGHEVTVLTTSAFGTLPGDDPWTVRTRDLEAPGLARRLLRRPEQPEVAGGAGAPPARPAPKLLTDGLVPDAKAVSWLPFAVGQLRRLVRERGIDVIVTNGPPDSVHLAGLAARGPGWVMDLEDGWRFEPQRDGWPTRVQDRLDAALEAHVIRRATIVTSVSRPIIDDAAARFGVPTALVPTAIPGAVPGSAPALEPGSVVHTGALSHAQRRDPRAFFTGLERLPTDSPVRLVLAGGMTEADQRLLDGLPPAVARRVTHLGALPRGDALALQRAADTLLLVATGPQRFNVTGKLFEYLGAGRPILAIADDNEAARIVRETRTGVVVAPDDPQGVADVLQAGIPFAPEGVDAYRLEAVADALERALTAAARPRGSGRRRGGPGGGRPAG